MSVLSAAALLTPLHRHLVQLPRTRRLRPVLASLAGRARTVLDVGSGSGEVGRAVAEQIGASFTGVDVVPGGSDVRVFDGVYLPFEDASFEAVLLCDVLHHARDAERLLAEAVRVAAKTVVLKDHFKFGALSDKMLLALDLIGNRPYGIDVLGRYFSPMEWVSLVGAAGASIEEMVWPLDVHLPLVRSLTRSELQFACRLRPRRDR